MNLTVKELAASLKLSRQQIEYRIKQNKIKPAGKKQVVKPRFDDGVVAVKANTYDLEQVMKCLN